MLEMIVGVSETAAAVRVSDEEEGGREGVRGRPAEEHLGRRLSVCEVCMGQSEGNCKARRRGRCDEELVWRARVGKEGGRRVYVQGVGSKLRESSQAGTWWEKSSCVEKRCGKRGRQGYRYRELSEGE